MKALLIASCAAVLLIAGCKGSDNTGPIVAKVQAAGAGDLSQTSDAGMEQWLTGHKDVAKSIQGDCGDRAKSQPATWRDSTEGRLCSADAKVMFFSPKDIYKPY